MTAYNTRAAATLSQKIARHPDHARTSAPSTGPSTDPSSCTAPTTPERRAAPVRRPEVRDEREGRRHEATTADALEHAPRDEHRHLDGERRDGGADDEDEQAAEQDPAPVEQVGQAADEGQHRDVAEEEAGDDRRRPLEGVDADADSGHHVGQREDDDIGVGGRERDGCRRCREQREAVRAGGRRGPHGRVVG